MDSKGGGLMPDPNIASRFDEIYNSTSKQVLAFITAKCKNTADIADILQDTYLELYQALRKRGAGYITNERSFVIRIAKQKLSRYYSLLERLRVFVCANGIYGDENEMKLSHMEDTAFKLEDYAVNHVLLENARELIQSKPEEIKKAFYLFYDAGLTIPEIASALSLRESSEKTRYTAR